MHWRYNVCCGDYQQDANIEMVRLSCNPLSIYLKSNQIKLFLLEAYQFRHVVILCSERERACDKVFLQEFTLVSLVEY